MEVQYFQKAVVEENFVTPDRILLANMIKKMMPEIVPELLQPLIW